MKNYTDITVLLDRSASMSNIKAAMEEGFDGFILRHRETPSTRVTLVQFDQYYDMNFLTRSEFETDVQTIYANLPVADVPRLQLVPRGNTPLIDALCKTIDATGARLKSLKEDDRPKAVLFLIITDGQENCSRSFTRADARKRVEHQEKTYDWQFIFLGSNQDALKEAATYGIAQDRAMTYTNSGAGAQSVFSNLATKSASFTRSLSGGATMAASAQSLNYNQADRDDVANEIIYYNPQGPTTNTPDPIPGKKPEQKP